MTFTETAAQLCGQSALLFGWRPDEFWGATPAELACIVRALSPQNEDPADSNLTAQMMELFPDAPTGGE